VAPPELFQDQQYPLLRRGRAPLLLGPIRGDRRGKPPATPSAR
jgi:hypothetical protein